MSPEVEAAIIAGGVGVLTVIVALYGTRKTSRDTRDGLNKQLAEQREALTTTLKAQGDQLDKTLAEQRTRTLNERFATAADKLGSDMPPAVRLAGVYAMAGLADDWEESRQTCIDVLCAYLRLPYEPDPGSSASTQELLDFYANREVRHTVIRIIAAHLREDAAISWQGRNFDFKGVVFDGGDFSDAVFSAGQVSFRAAKFTGGEVIFHRVKFTGGIIGFYEAEFTGGKVDFALAKFTDGWVLFDGAKFTGSDVDFTSAEFVGGKVTFERTEFASSCVTFDSAKFVGSSIHFHWAEFNGGEVRFGGTKFTGGTVSFSRARFTGGDVDFRLSEFSGSTVDFSMAGVWSYPPEFPWTDTPPSGVKLPRKEDQPQG